MADPTDRLDLLMVTPNFPPDIGGMQTYSVELARQFADRCDRFAVVAPRRPGCKRVDADLPFEVVRCRSLGDNLALSGILPVARAARRERLPIAFCTHWSAAFAALNAPGGWPGAVVCAAHGKEILLKPFERFGPLQYVYDRMRRHVFRRADRFVAVSRFTASLLSRAGVDPARIGVVGNGVDPDFFTPDVARPARADGPAAHGKRLLTVARLVPRKGIDHVLRALPAVRAAVPDVEYVVVGDGPDRARLEAIAKETGVAERVRWVREADRDALVRFYNDCDLYVMPSTGEPPDVEGFGLTFLEASACGKPVLGSTEGGIPDAIRHRETGLTIDLGESGALERGIIELLTDVDRARAMGEAGRQHVLTTANWAASARGLLREIGYCRPRSDPQRNT